MKIIAEPKSDHALIEDGLLILLLCCIIAATI